MAARHAAAHVPGVTDAPWSHRYRAGVPAGLRAWQGWPLTCLARAPPPDEMHRESIAKLELGRQRALRTGFQVPKLDRPVTCGS